MEKIVDNDFSSRLPENQEQELNEIAGKVNILLGRIQKSIQSVIELEKQKAELETKQMALEKQQVELQNLQLMIRPAFSAEYAGYF